IATAEAAASAWSRRSLVLTALAVDSLMLVASVATAELVSRHAAPHKMSVFWLVGFGALALGLLYKRGLYDWRVRLQILDDLRRVLTATLLALATILSLRVLLGRTDEVSAQAIRLWALGAG